MAVKLKDAADRCKFLEREDGAAQKDLEKITVEAKDTRSAMRAMKEELRQAGDIMVGKPYMLRMKFGDPKYAPLDRKWSAANTYLDLAASAADATKHFRGLDDHKLEELFWSQFHNPERPLSAIRPFGRLGGAEQVVRTRYEVRRESSVAGEAGVEELFWLGVAVPWFGAAC